MEATLVKELVDHLADEREAVLVYRDAIPCGHDYLVTGRGELSGNTKWWFEITGSRVHEQRAVEADDLHHALRVGMVTSGPRAGELRHEVAAAFGDRVLTHSFEAIHRADPVDAVHVLEIFAAGVSKWQGLTRIAEARGIPHDRIAAIGDEINDLTMLREAGLSVAMGNAVPEAKAAAMRQTRSNAEAGVAHAIERMLSGAW